MEETIEYRILRENRRTVGMEITEFGLIVKVPTYMTDSEAADFVVKHRRWIKTHTQSFETRKKQAEMLEPITADDVDELCRQAVEYIPQRVKIFAAKFGVTVRKITIRNQLTRWGSCSAKGDLNFNCLLMLTPHEVIDSVVAHELCHRRVMNHSKQFYDELLKICPDYYECDKWLKQNGKLLMDRMRKGMEN